MSTKRQNLDPRSFGRGRTFVSAAVAAPRPAISEDLKLFAMTYFAGFLFVSLYLA